MNKEQTALDVSRDIELKKVLPQQAAITLTDDQIATLRKGLRDWETPENRYAAQRLLDSLIAAPVAQQSVPAMPVAWRDSLAMTVARLEEDAEMFDQCGQNSTAEDRRARAYELTQMLAAAPKVDAAVPADQGAREPAAWMVANKYNGGHWLTTNKADLARADASKVTPLYAAVPAEQGAQEREEDEYVINRLATILADVAIALKGPELPRHRHGYHDLAEVASVMRLERDLLKMQNEELLAAAPSQGAKEAAPVAIPEDPMDWPLPCDVKVGAGTMRKGVSLRTLVMRMEVLHRMAMKNGVPAMPAAQDIWRDKCETLLDIWDDQNNPPESRCYIEGALRMEFDELRPLIAAPAVAQQEAAQPVAWISVEELLPAEQKNVLVWPHEKVAVYIKAFSTDTTAYAAGFYEDNGVDPLNGVTHWQPCPLAPGAAPITQQDSRNAVLEESARVCDSYAKSCVGPMSHCAKVCAESIRALKNEA